MNHERITKSTAEALSEAKALADRRGNTTVEAPHIALALVSKDGGLIPEVFASMGKSVGSIKQGLEGLVGALATTSGAGSTGGAYFSTESTRLIEAADRVREKMGDEYLSTEHLMTAIISGGGRVAELLRREGITEGAFSEALG